MKKLLILFLLSSPVQAFEIPDGLPLFVGAMAAGAIITEPDKGSHYYIGFVTGTWGTIFTKSPYWGAGIGCGLGAAKEAYDRNNGVADVEDFAYTCVAAIISSYATNRILIYYKNRPMIGYRKEF